MLFFFAKYLFLGIVHDDKCIAKHCKLHGNWTTTPLMVILLKLFGFLGAWRCLHVHYSFLLVGSLCFIPITTATQKTDLRHKDHDCWTLWFWKSAGSELVNDSNIWAAWSLSKPDVVVLQHDLSMIQRAVNSRTSDRRYKESQDVSVSNLLSNQERVQNFIS